MYKTHLLQNKDVIIAVSIAVGIFFLLAYNLVTLIPEVLKVSLKEADVTNQLPIDTETDNKAIELLQGK